MTSQGQPAPLHTRSSQRIHGTVNTPSNCLNNSGGGSILNTVLRIFTANEPSHCATWPRRADCCTTLFARLMRCFSYACKAEATVGCVVRHVAKAAASSIAWQAPCPVFGVIGWA